MQKKKSSTDNLKVWKTDTVLALVLIGNNPLRQLLPQSSGPLIEMNMEVFVHTF